MCLFKKKEPSDNSKKEIRKYKPLGKKGELYSFFVTYTDGTSEVVDITLESQMYQKIYLFHLAHERPVCRENKGQIEMFYSIDED